MNYFLPLIALLFLSPNLFAATPFMTKIEVASQVEPSQKQLDQLSEQCSTAALQVQGRLKQVLEKESVEVADLSVEPYIHRWSSDEAESTYTCLVHISGVSESVIGFSTIETGVKHLRHHGYHRALFSHACDQISAEDASNPDEIYQRSEVSFAIFPGNYCTVASTILTVLK